jgi:hypothetical protein
MMLCPRIVSPSLHRRQQVAERIKPRFIDRARQHGYNHVLINARFQGRKG